jgi:ribosomal protein L11 methyltransferase
MPTWSVTVDVPAEDADLRSDQLFEAGASGVELRDGSVAPMPGARQPAPGRAVLVAWFTERDDADAAAGELEGAEVAEVADQDWGESWKAGLGAFTVGRVRVRPSWVEEAPGAGEVEVVLDPGMAFGTGTHATTALCLAAISAWLEARPGARVFDVGTGSGLLAIAARKLGAGRVVGSDNDPVAVQVARENAARNGAEVELTTDDVPQVRGPFDLVVANILANTLVELAPAIAAQVAEGGVVLLSGILAHQEGEVREAYLAHGLSPAPEIDRTEGEWSLVALRRRAR